MIVQSNNRSTTQKYDMRIWAGIIDIADHFLGCDSLGQHIVKALGKKATIVTEVHIL